MVGERGFEPPTPLVPNTGDNILCPLYSIAYILLSPSHFCPNVPILGLWVTCNG
jgi:hypothetical protein